MGFVEWIFSYSLGCHLWLYERTNLKKKRGRRSPASREGYRRLQYNIQHNHIFTAQNQPQKYIHSFWELQQMFTYLKLRPTAFPTPIKHCLRGENINKPNKTKQQNQNTYMTYLIYGSQLPSCSTWGFWVIGWPKIAKNIQNMQVAAL